MLFYTVRRHA